MKKITIIFFLITIWFSTKIFADNYKFTKKDNLIINKINYVIKPKIENWTLEFRINLEKAFNKIQKDYSSNAQIYNIFKQIKIDNYMFDFQDEYTKDYKDFNIDYKKVQTEWLKWHNNVRNQIKVPLYSYDSRLNNTAYEWSKEQVKIWKISHERYKNDGFYNYQKIENWFNNRWIKCIPKNWATTSESIWKFWYYCSDSDCTNEFLESLKDIFDIYMNEKWLKYPANAHYRWITLDTLSKIWIWVGFYKTDEKDYYQYYVTTHYCTKFIK